MSIIDTLRGKLYRFFKKKNIKVIVGRDAIDIMSVG